MAEASPKSTAANADKDYLDPDVLSGIRRIDVRARLVVEGYITGMHKSPFNGVAIEFASHREYVPGDEIKHIDWKLWSRTDRLYIKEYEEETNLRCTIILDGSKSMAYGEKRGKKGDENNAGMSKYDYAATAAAALAHLLTRQQDTVGLVTFTDKVTANLPPSSNSAHLKKMVHQMSVLQPAEATDFDGVFPDLAAQIPRRGLIVIFSDLFADLEHLKTALQQFRLRKHDVVLFHVMHDDEINFPFAENTKFVGLEVDEELQTDPRALRESYLKVVGEFQDQVRKECSRQGIDYLLLNTKDRLDAVLNKYLAFRNSTKGQRRL